MDIQAGDVVIRKGKHLCDVRFVESADETGILLVNGIANEFYEADEFEVFASRYQSLCKKEVRLDINTSN